MNWSDLGVFKFQQIHLLNIYFAGKSPLPYSLLVILVNLVIYTLQ